MSFSIKINEKKAFIFLIIWIFIGCVASLDYSRNWGDIYIYEPFWKARNLIFSGISMLWIVLAFSTKNKRLKTVFCSIELLYWLSKLYIIKDGYSVGLAGAPDISIVSYDFIALLTRLYLISEIINLRKFTPLKNIIIVLLILFVKIQFLSPAPYTSFIIKKYSASIEESKQQMIGNWEGSYTKVKDDDVIVSGDLQITISSDTIVFTKTDGIEKYHFDLDAPNYGALSNDFTYKYYSLQLDNVDSDSLVFNINKPNEKLSFSLKK